MLCILFSFPSGLLGAQPWIGSSLQSYTGIWDMPNARVLPDWNVRLHFGQATPYAYYGGAVGFFDRLEVNGQITGVSSVPKPFPNGNYGEYKDRSVGGKLVLLKERPLFPQVAVGANDPYGTSLFGQRYLVASKRMGPVDITLGLGQGILGGDGSAQTGSNLLLADPFRETKPFAGVEIGLHPRVMFSAEYSPIEYEKVFGRAQKDQPVNVGLKFKVTDWLRVHAGYMRGKEALFGFDMQLPLKPEGMLTWVEDAPYTAGEKLKWEAYLADPKELAKLVAEELYDQGFDQVECACTHTTVWVALTNTRSLSDARALGRIGRVVDAVLPQRVDTLYVNLKWQGQVIQSLRVERKVLTAYLESRMDRETFLDYADLDLYGSRHWQEFSQKGKVGRYTASEPWYAWGIEPKIQTLFEDPGGFLLHKGIVILGGSIFPWDSARLSATYDFTIFNDFDRAQNVEPLEKNPPATGWLEYEDGTAPRLSSLAFTQTFPLPWDTRGKATFGYFDSQYAGVGGETFRYFHDGLWGLGLESEVVRKRAVDDDFALRQDLDKKFYTSFVNLYAQLWPSQGVEAGLKAGRFLGGDKGVRVELRRSYRYFTIGAWATFTRGGDFSNDLNKNYTFVGSYIRIPFSIFANNDAPGHFQYEVTGFERDVGRTVRFTDTLFPVDPWSTPLHTKQTLNDMR